MGYSQQKTFVKKKRASYNHPVAQRNDFLQNARYKMTRVQHSILLYTLYKVKPNDTPDTTYQGSYRELYDFLGYKYDSFFKIKKLIKEMETLTFWMDSAEPGKDARECPFFKTINTDTVKGCFSFVFSEEFSPYIFALTDDSHKNKRTKYFTTVELVNVLSLKNFYSQRLYLILKTYSFNLNYYDFEMGTGTKNDLLKLLVGKGKEAVILGEWRKWSIIKNNIIQKAKEEINECTDLQIEYEINQEESTRKHLNEKFRIRIGFLQKTISKNSSKSSIVDMDPEETETFPKIDSFLQNHLLEAPKVESEKSEAEDSDSLPAQTDDQAEKERRIKSSDHKTLTHMLWKEFKEDEINQIYNTAIPHIKKRGIKESDEELFICNFVAHYKNKIFTSDKTTSTTELKRLLDLINNDYDNYKYDPKSSFFSELQAECDHINEPKSVAAYLDNDKSTASSTSAVDSATKFEKYLADFRQALENRRNKNGAV